MPVDELEREPVIGIGPVVRGSEDQEISPLLNEFFYPR